MSNFKAKLRPLKNATYSLIGFLYDYKRYLLYTNWRGLNAVPFREFKAIKLYHKLEKSLSFKIRNKSSGRGVVKDYFELLSSNEGKKFSFHEAVGIKVVVDFLEQGEGKKFFEKEALEYFSYAGTDGGVKILSNSDVTFNGENYSDSFFYSRRSIRNYTKDKVPADLITRAVKLAIRTPSVCNRQAWHVYTLQNEALIKKALSYQNGNKGFGENVSNLLILCSDLAAFDVSSERYQHWIDGGMFSMSLVWALHSLGISSCCLNWSKDPFDDLAFRNAFNIKPSHSILMMVAIGYPEEEVIVCDSARSPAQSYITKLG
jgi:nitroreductase